MPQYYKMVTKEQQSFSAEMAEALEKVATQGDGSNLTKYTANVSSPIRAMIEDNNQIICSNGLKMLTTLTANNHQLLASSFPLHFIFSKFKTHETHPINSLLLNLVTALIQNGSRITDLLIGIQDSLKETKANVKYGASMSLFELCKSAQTKVIKLS